jgi:hypothetical protein
MEATNTRDVDVVFAAAVSVAVDVAAAVDVGQ